MSWGILLLASFFECTWAISMKFADGFRNLRWTIVMFIAMVVSMVLLAIAARDMPMATAYAVWTGVGAIGTVLVGIIAFGESSDRRRWASLILIILGVILLRWSDGGSSTGGEDSSVDLSVDIGQPVVAAGMIEGESLVVHA